VPWLDLVRAYLWVEGRAANAGLGLRHDLTMAEVHRTMFARARPAEAQALGVDDCDGSFLELLEQARVVAMTDPRDRIYAFLSLAAAAGGGNNGSDADLIRTIQPNYKDSFHHAYLEFAHSYVRSSRDGCLLHHVSMMTKHWAMRSSHLGSRAGMSVITTHVYQPALRA
jgi:hypothetical protein